MGALAFVPEVVSVAATAAVGENSTLSASRIVEPSHLRLFRIAGVTVSFVFGKEAKLSLRTNADRMNGEEGGDQRAQHEQWQPHLTSRITQVDTARARGGARRQIRPPTFSPDVSWVLTRQHPFRFLLQMFPLSRRKQMRATLPCHLLAFPG